MKNDDIDDIVKLRRREGHIHKATLGITISTLAVGLVACIILIYTISFVTVKWSDIDLVVVKVNKVVPLVTDATESIDILGKGLLNQTGSIIPQLQNTTEYMREMLVRISAIDFEVLGRIEGKLDEILAKMGG